MNNATLFMFGFTIFLFLTISCIWYINAIKKDNLTNFNYKNWGDQ